MKLNSRYYLSLNVWIICFVLLTSQVHCNQNHGNSWHRALSTKQLNIPWSLFLVLDIQASVIKYTVVVSPYLHIARLDGIIAFHWYGEKGRDSRCIQKSYLLYRQAIYYIFLCLWAFNSLIRYKSLNFPQLFFFIYLQISNYCTHICEPSGTYVSSMHICERALFPLLLIVDYSMFQILCFVVYLKITNNVKKKKSFWNKTESWG